MSQFIKKILLFPLPLLLLFFIPIWTFLNFDPFKILKKYNEYNNSIVSYNEDFIATERFLNNKGKFNSFILGSSRAGCGFDGNDWKLKLNKSDEVYSFVASTESIYGMRGKLRLLDKENVPINNLLLIIDSDLTLGKTVNSKGHLYIKHPRVSDESRYKFITEYLKDYIFTGFFIRYLDYKLFKTKRDYMIGFLNFDSLSTDSVYVPFNVTQKEHKILLDVHAYYDERKNIFYNRPDRELYSEQKINLQCLEILKEIKCILEKNNTNYKIIISPLYDQKKINDADLKTLKYIFTSENVFDFSGKNNITNDIHNYYEESHYRKHVGNYILSLIYETKNQNVINMH